MTTIQRFDEVQGVASLLEILRNKENFDIRSNIIKFL